MRLTHIMEGNLLYLKSADYRYYSHLKNAFTEKSRLMFDQTTGHHGLAKWAHKINHHSHVFLY